MRFMVLSRRTELGSGRPSGHKILTAMGSSTKSWSRRRDARRRGLQPLPRARCEVLGGKKTVIDGPSPKQELVAASGSGSASRRRKRSSGSSARPSRRPRSRSARSSSRGLRANLTPSSRAEERLRKQTEKRTEEVGPDEIHDDGQGGQGLRAASPSRR